MHFYDESNFALAIESSFHLPRLAYTVSSLDLTWEITLGVVVLSLGVREVLFFLMHILLIKNMKDYQAMLSVDMYTCN